MASDQQPVGPPPPPTEPEPQSQPVEQQQQPVKLETTARPIPPAILPDKNVTSETIEDAYISFMLYCNPALPPDCEVSTLRDAFRIPPRSQAKEFSPWSVFDKVKKFYNKEIPTWTEMVIQLGVDPPDLSKDESAQKLTQYGVRLKKWLQSYHVKPFFEYLMDIPNEYWTDIPTGSDPTNMPIRDGIRIEDDMALRALLPHIRPKRGRKRPMDQEVSTPLSARPVAFVSPWQPHGGTPLSAHPGNMSSTGQPLLAPNDGSHTPLSRYPSSAVTPTTRSGFWDSPSTPRRGAKGVSSAWRVAGQDNGKTRGRPPMERTPMERTPIEAPGGVFSAWPTRPPLPPKKKQRNQVSGTTTPTDITNSQPPAPAESPAFVPSAPIAPMGETPPPTLDRTTSAPVPGLRSWSQSDVPRPARPSISLQVPQRAGGNVRLATPPPPSAPPAVMATREYHQQQQPLPEPPVWQPLQEQPPSQPYQHPSDAYHASTKEQLNTNNPGTQTPKDGLPRSTDIEDYYFERIPERTNVDTLLSFFMRATQDGQWFDHTGAPAEPASMDEATAITNCTLQEMLGTATSAQAFLINLGALAGARTLMTTRPKYYRLPDGDDCHHYKFEWEYRFGPFKEHFNMRQRVPWTMFKKPVAPEGEEEGETGGEAGMSAEEWKGKYKTLLDEVKKRDQELADLRGKVMSSLMEDLK